jgi:predicted Holliday junction resolvase-like endonuclease
MSVYNKNNKFMSYLIIVATFFIVVLFTKNEIVKIQENIDLRDTYTIELESKKTQLEEINKKRAMLNNSSENIDKYIVEIKEDEIIDYLYSYIEETNKRNGVSIIKSISISDPHDTEL